MRMQSDDAMHVQALHAPCLALHWVVELAQLCKVHISKWQ